ncbi:sugar lactone lactonase YvrE [Paenibacillus phyllosphaerae]|uniref:Sugar lactone lactonase YvrE n=1 Tax=Paenibacillus phyllosphaerae TaxID=274593 RepID=A0A7W5FKJ1_9BACL|nr:NHL repeat-containing protein [Paenibacillus phyllosphaerae]MBB3108029.1 sugar lactone lactonase YvrE [Paenibacillus phyllosphaerae]
MLKRIAHLRGCLLLAICCLLGLGAGGTLVHANDGASSYNYSYWGDTVAAPRAYEATSLYNGAKLGAGQLKNPADLFVTADQQLYVLDSGNNRILVLDRQFKLLRVIDSFQRDGKQESFLNPQGLFVTDRQELIVADTGNKRIVHLDQDGRLVKVIDSPKSELLAEGFKFEPVRVVADKAQRIYAMAAGVYDGFMEFSASGDFTSFIGANRVNFDPTDYLWKMLSTRQQRSQMVMFTPTEFTNLDINDEGFLYATNGQASDNVKKLNAQGSDILRREGYFPPEGDIRFTSLDGPTRLVDIDVADSEIFAILDATRGRIFTYNGDGHFMYVFGGIGNQLGEFNTPVAIERLGDDYLVLDQALGEITVFQSTEYGRTLNEAVRSYYKGEEEKAYELFQQTINMNANLEFAYSGIGKALLRQGEYGDAMRYFKQSMDQKGYSKAFLLYRKQVLREHFTAIMTGVAVLAVALVLLRRYLKHKGGKKNVPMEA